MAKSRRTAFRAIHVDYVPTHRVYVSPAKWGCDFARDMDS